MAKKTVAGCIEKASLLYEKKRSAVSAATAFEMYIRRLGPVGQIARASRQATQ
jgi:hypothetical protein